MADKINIPPLENLLDSNFLTQIMDQLTERIYQLEQRIETLENDKN